MAKKCIYDFFDGPPSTVITSIKWTKVVFVYFCVLVTKFKASFLIKEYGIRRYN